MFQEVLKSEEFIVFIIQGHVVVQNSFSMQNKIIISFPTKIKNTSTENKIFISIFFFQFGRYVDNIIIYLHLCQKAPGRNFRKVNKLAIFTSFEVFSILFLASQKRTF